MTTEQIKAVLARVLTWPHERQERAARILSELEDQDESPYQLTNDQVAEVERRLADPHMAWLTSVEVRERLRKLGE
jgi:hypothetical protein